MVGYRSGARWMWSGWMPFSLPPFSLPCVVPDPVFPYYPYCNIVCVYIWERYKFCFSFTVIALCRGFLPAIIAFLRRVPVIGSLLNLPGISAVSQHLLNRLGAAACDCVCQGRVACVCVCVCSVCFCFESATRVHSVCICEWSADSQHWQLIFSLSCS